MIEQQHGGGHVIEGVAIFILMAFVLADFNPV